MTVKLAVDLTKLRLECKKNRLEFNNKTKVVELIFKLTEVERGGSMKA